MSRQQWPRAARTREDVGGVTLWDALRALYSPAAHLRSNLRLVLGCLWRHANYDGETWPSLGRLAAETELSSRSVIRAVTGLKDVGAITVARGGGRRRTSVYFVSGEWVAATLHAEKRASDGEIARNGDSQSPFETDDDETAANDEGGLKGANESPFPAGKSDTVAPFSGKGDRDDRNGDTESRKGDSLARNGDRQSQVVVCSALEVPLEAGGRRRARATPDVPSLTRTPERIANTIAAATARLGGDLAREGRNIADRFRSERSATTAWSCLGSLAKRAGVKREALGVSFEAIHAAGYAPCGPEESP